ncbi:MAG: ATP-dependent Clp protease adaptor ClpS [Sphingobacteriales bacterium]|nr:MAG: ATP-dependent Clp protease adaptor ClpS [Sphingobacteriales bacterium]
MYLISEKETAAVYLTQNNQSKPFHEEDTDVLVDEDLSLNNSIVVWNDDVNTFDWVIESLVEVCDHTLESAEQCALIIHFSGKYAVKKGSFDDLRPKCEALLDRGISATIQ